MNSLLEEPLIMISRSRLANKDLSVSKKHAKVENKEGCIGIYDMGTLNGTFVNG